MFVDASAAAAVLLNEDDARLQLAKMLDAEEVLVSAMSHWETMRACTKERRMSVLQAKTVTTELFASLRARYVGVGEHERDLAVMAYEQYGRGQHRAKLNMGDCFAYACAKANEAPLLFKGDDFVHTDIERA